MKIHEYKPPPTATAQLGKAHTHPTPSRFPVVGRTKSTNEPIVGHIDYGEWCVLQDGRVSSPSGTKSIAGRVNLSASKVDFSMIRVRQGALHALLGGLVEAGPMKDAWHADASGSQSPLPPEILTPRNSAEPHH